MFRSLFRAAGAVVAASLLALPMQAQPITYTFSGTGSGSYGGSAFTDAAFTVSIQNDLSNPDQPFASIPSFGGLVGTISIMGVLTDGTFGNALYVFSNPTVPGVGFGSGASDYLDILTPAVIGYDLRANFGPVTGPTFAVNQFNNVSVSGQALTFTSIPTATFEASGLSTTAPEPASLALVGTGLAGLVITARRRRRA